MAKTIGLIDDFTVLKDYRDRLKERPASQRVFG
jgi:hypothetical protein